MLTREITTKVINPITPTLPLADRPISHRRPNRARFVEFPDGFRSKAEVLKTDEMWDPAVLLISRPVAHRPAIRYTCDRRGGAPWNARPTKVTACHEGIKL